MKVVADISQTELANLFNEASSKNGRISAAAMEKDFWICWVLSLIFEHPQLSRWLRFKGGTSLSKCFNLIDRFSEDIDLILDWTALTDENPNSKRSRTQQDKVNKRINQSAVDFIASKLLPLLSDALTPYCTAKISEQDSHIININYPQNFTDKYQRSEIKLEIGPLASMIPSGRFTVKPYVADEYPNIFKQAETSVVAINAERTFWEKITILHSEAHRPVDKPLSLRYSRHYYDVYKMLGTLTEARALENLVLLQDVVEFKDRFYHSSWANYDLAKPGSIILTPEETTLSGLQKDYANMRQMIFGDYPSFDVIMESIKLFNEKINNLPKE